jgi:cytoskeleton protein RodZ
MSLGSDLLAARTEAGLTLEHVADRTRIRRTVIERIEADDFSLCGGDVYARGHIRTIAAVVGTDPVPLVAEFDRLHAPHAPLASEVFESETSTKRERGGPNWTAAMAGALLVVAVIVVFQVARGGSSAPSAAGTGSTPAVTSTGSSGPTGSTTGSTPTQPTPTQSPSPTVIAKVPPSSQGVVVRLEVTTGNTWISATGGGSKLFEGLLKTGAVKIFTDPKQVKIVVGNAGAVRLTVNGVDIGTPGATGQVVRLSFDPGDPIATG